MPILTALRQLHGDYGDVAAGAQFVVSDELAEQLEAQGVVERYRPAAKAKPAHDNKMLRSSESK